MVALFNSNRSIRIQMIACILLLISSTFAQLTFQMPDFDAYCKQFNKNYDNGEYRQRQKNYNNNIQYIKESNLNGYGVNMFTDWSAEEMAKLKGGYQADIPKQPFDNTVTLHSVGMTLTDKTPASYDWRDYDAVTAVKHQLSCGACWAFSTTAFFESDLIINNNYTNQIDLSEQFLLKCDNRSLKCNGGFLFWAMDRIIEESTGMPTENQYPYNFSNLYKEDLMCYETDLIKIDSNRKLVSYYEIEDTAFIEKLILKKPVNVNLCSKDMQFYAPTQSKRTLFCNPNSQTRDHTVLLIGYTETEWIIKNQWSTTWGVEGFAYISKTSTSDCCIGKQLHTTGVVSQKCLIDNCDLCVEETSCFQCSSGYYVVNVNSQHVCKACDKDYCTKCVNFFGVCDVCVEGYSVTYPTYACAKSTVDHCSFMYLNQCSECDEGYVLNSQGKCVSERLLCYVTGCQQCKEYAPTVCIACSSGYILNSKTKLCEVKSQCNIQNCTKCIVNDPNQCQVCSQSNFQFSLSQGKCVPLCLIEGCKGCSVQNVNSTILCNACRSGYKLAADGKSCLKCSIQYCADCSNNSETSCEKCLAGFYFNQTNSKCLSCNAVNNCIECSLIKGKSLACLKCASGFTPNQNGTECIRCLSSCVSCSYPSLSVCSSDCGPTNFFVQKVCSKCSLNCESCLDNSTCSKCISGFTINGGKCVLECKQGSKCANCQYAFNQSTCTECTTGYIMVNQACVLKKDYECLQQNGQNPDGCSTCPQKYYLNSKFDRKICSKCTSSDANCIGCLSFAPQKCSKCADQYYLEKMNSTCVQCASFDSNCLNCNGKNVCTECSKGFYLLSVNSNDQNAGICSPCSPSCLTCRYNSQFCQSCQDKYQLTINNKCVRSAKIQFTIVLDADFDKVLNSLLTDIYGSLMNVFKLSSFNDIQILNVQKGSIHVTGDLHMPAGQNDKTAFLQNIRNALTGQTKIASYPLLSSSVALTTETSPSDPTDTEAINAGKLPIAVLIGISVGCVVFALIVIVILVMAIRRHIHNKSKQIQDDAITEAKEKVKGNKSNKQNSVKQKSVKAVIKIIASDTQKTIKSSKSIKETEPTSQKSRQQTKRNEANEQQFVSHYSFKHPNYIKDQIIVS